MSGVLLRRLFAVNSSARVLNSAFLNKWAVRENSNNVVHSALPDIEIPDTTIPEYVFKDFSKFPNKIAMECGLTGKKFTYEEVRIKSRNLNRALRKRLKLVKGDVVALLLPNVPEFPICTLGALEAGLTVTTINPVYTVEEIRRQLLDSGSKAIITLTALWPVVQAAIKDVPGKIPVLTIKMQETETIPEGTIDFKEFTDIKVDIEDGPPSLPDDVVLMPYSSGTTGLPKGVQLTHRNMVANLCQVNDPIMRLSEYTSENHQDVIPGVLPWFHIYGITAVLLNHLYNQCKIVSLPRFTPELYVTTLAKHKPNVLFIVPPIVIFMSSHPSVKKEYLHSIRSVVSGAAPLGALDEEKLIKKAEKHINMLQGYGLTETSPCVFMTSPIRKKEFNVSGSTGETVANTVVKVVPVDNVSGEPLGPNQPGELLVKGPQVMKGYHNKPQETQEVFVDGWLRTGDLVYYDENKMFYITDRLKELIKVKGFQVAPAELEELIRSHPEVSDTAVIGVPHDIHGEVPRAYVVPKPNVQLNPQKLKDFVADKVASFKQLKGGVAVVDSIPKNASGKIMRRELKLQYEKEK